jgi:N-methylhydantoinase B
MGSVFYPLDHDMTLSYAADSTSNPPRGVLGGTTAKASYSKRLDPDGSDKVLPAFSEEAIPAGSRIAFTACGGGCGEPLQRDSERVLRAVNRGWLSSEVAREVCRMALAEATEPGVHGLDAAETAGLRGSA